MSIYLVKSGENTFEYEKICDEISLLIINRVIRSMRYTQRNWNLNGNDIQMLKNSGGTFLCRTNKNIMIWLINIEHEQDRKIGDIFDNELLSIISNLISTIKRDLILNKVL
jgi:hypothetical protein